MQIRISIVAIFCMSIFFGYGLPARANDVVVHAFQGGNNGAVPEANLLNVNGILYGTTTNGGSPSCSSGDYGCGTVFSVNLATRAEQVLYTFQGNTDGANPIAGLISVKGVLYGTTVAGGSDNCSGGCGVVFSVNPKNGKEKIIYSFQGGSDGWSPYGGLVDVGGVLYGTTEFGGSGPNCGNFACGTVFSVDPKTGIETVLYSFQGGSDGANPLAGLINVGGILYGTTYVGGSTSCGSSNGCGTVFSVNLVTGVEKGLYSFQANDGSFPRSSLIQAGGKLYGTTYGGGSGLGTVFSFNLKTGMEKVVYSFVGGSDGDTPFGNLIDVGGMLYGTTASGGNACMVYTDGCGTVFSINLRTGEEAVLFSFQDGSDGASPFAGLIALGNTLYGTTGQGGGCTALTDGCGTVFGLTP